MPDVDPVKFPEQHWAHRNIRIMVSRLSAHVKEKRRSASAGRAASPTRENLRNSVHNSESDEMDIYEQNEFRENAKREELARVQHSVREQFGGSLSTMLQSSKAKYRSKSQPPSTARQRPAPTPKNKVQSTSTNVPIIRVENRPVDVPRMECRGRQKYRVVEEDSSLPMQRYGLRGKHIELPETELDMTTKSSHTQNDHLRNLADWVDFDETDVPRSAASPQCCFADPVSDDMFLRSMEKRRRPIRF